MKKTMIIAVAVMMVAALSGSAFAANSLASGSKALTIGFGDSVLNNVANPTDQNQNNPIVDIGGKFFVGKDMAITAGVGFQMNTGDLEGTYLSFNVGARKYLKTDDFAPFVGGQLSYITYDAELPAAQGGKYVDFSAIEFSAMVGAEYFVGKQFSIEGSIGLAIGKAEDDQNNLDTTYIGTKNLGVRANFYF
ncbi:MAG: outer membrane beta-barrel protein [Nitrospirota bacterium]